MNFSVRNALTGLWILLLAICVGLAFFLVELYEQLGSTQIKQTEALVQQAGEAVNKRYKSYLGNRGFRASETNDVQQIRELNLLLTLVLTQFDGVEGGYWTPKGGFLAYAFPSYGGPEIIKDPPASELRAIADINANAISVHTPQLKNLARERRSIVIYAVPITTIDGPAVIWTMSWATVKNSEVLTQIVIALSILFTCSLVSGIALCIFLYRWSIRVSRLRDAIGSATTIEQIPQLERTGHQELDQVVEAVNLLSMKLRESQAAAERLSKELARADKLSALGRMVGGFAHEIRNPLATIHLSVENALENASGHQERLLKNVLQESQSLQLLMQKFLSIAKIHALKPTKLPLDKWLNERLDNCRALAQDKAITLSASAPSDSWSFDNESLCRAVNNLIVNAIQNTPRDGWVSVAASAQGGVCTFVVEDSGAGVAEEKQEMIFEPLYTSRADGTGLGLTIVREIAQAHGGEVRCRKGNTGARFELEIPWLRS